MKFYMHPWRLATFAIGLALLFWGASTDEYPDWDYGISVAMALSTYLVMPTFDRWFRSGNLLEMIGAVILLGACVDTVYAGYLMSFRMTLELREVNFFASTSLFLGCWVVWCLLPEAVNRHHEERERELHRRGRAAPSRSNL